jgi:hypothetical protein
VKSDRVLRVGVIVTVLGLLITLIAMLPLVIDDLTLPGIWWFLSMITGVGLFLIIVGLILGARERR